jgi:hypothetical protein
LYFICFPQENDCADKLNCSSARKLHRDCTEGNKNTKTILLGKKEGNVYSVSIQGCRFAIFNRGRKIALIWFGNIPNNNK